MRAEIETRSSAEAGPGRIGHAVRLLAGSVARVLGRIGHSRRRRADTRALMMLDDRLLDDLGLKRSDLTAAVYGDVPLGAIRPEPVRRPAEIHVLPSRQPQGDARGKDLGEAA